MRNQKKTNKDIMKWQVATEEAIKKRHDEIWPPRKSHIETIDIDYEEVFKDLPLLPEHGRFNCNGDYIWPTGEVTRKKDL